MKNKAPLPVTEKQNYLDIIRLCPSLTEFNFCSFLVEVYDPIFGRWRDAEAMSMLRSRVGVAVMQNRLYAIGGYNGQERLNTVEVFDAKTKRWSKVAAMNCKRSAVGAVALGDHLYVCGGFDGISSLDTVERFDPEENTWTMMPSMTKVSY